MPTLPGPSRPFYNPYNELPLPIYRPAIPLPPPSMQLHAWDYALLYTQDGSIGIVTDYIGFIHVHSPWAESGHHVLDYLSNRQRKKVSVGIGQIFPALMESQGREAVRVGDACYHPFEGGKEWTVSDGEDSGKVFERWGVKRIAAACRAAVKREEQGEIAGEGAAASGPGEG